MMIELIWWGALFGLALGTIVLANQVAMCTWGAIKVLHAQFVKAFGAFEF